MSKRGSGGAADEARRPTETKESTRDATRRQPMRRAAAAAAAAVAVDVADARARRRLSCVAMSLVSPKTRSPHINAANAANAQAANPAAYGRPFERRENGRVSNSKMRVNRRSEARGWSLGANKVAAGRCAPAAVALALARLFSQRGRPKTSADLEQTSRRDLDTFDGAEKLRSLFGDHDDNGGPRATRASGVEAATFARARRSRVGRIEPI